MNHKSKSIKSGSRCPVSLHLPESSSVPAISQIYQSETKLRKLFYFIIFASALCVCSSHIYKFMCIYLKYPVVTSIEVENKLYVEFPAVTVCNLNKAKTKDIHDKQEVAQGGGGTLVLTLRKIFITLEGEESPSLQKLHRELTSFNNQYVRLSAAERKNFGHQLDEMVEECYFDTIRCHPANFTLFQNLEYGNCYTFSSGRNNNGSKLTSYKVGPESGLELVINIRVEDYIDITPSVGLRVVVHNANEDPDPVEKGINISPGFETHIVLTKFSIRRLPPPYRDHCIDYDRTINAHGFSSQLECVRNCTQTRSSILCSCVDPFLPSGFEKRQCDLQNATEMACLNDVVEDMEQQGLPYDCPIACHIDYFNTEVFSSAWPLHESTYSSYFYHKKSKKAVGDCNATDCKQQNGFAPSTPFIQNYDNFTESNDFYDFGANDSSVVVTNIFVDPTQIRPRHSDSSNNQNLNRKTDQKISQQMRVKLKVYFRNFDNTVYLQNPMFAENEIISHVGGLLNLWLGLSVLALYELLESSVLILKSLSQPR